MRPRDRVRAWMRKDLLIRYEAPYPELEKKCLLWVGSTNNGYAWTTIDNKQTLIYVWVWTVKNGKPRLQVNHKCDRRNCIEPAHLYDGTHKENMRDIVNRGSGRGTLTYFECGHARENNTTLITHSTTYTEEACTECKRRRGREWMRKKRAYSRS